MSIVCLDFACTLKRGKSRKSHQILALVSCPQCTKLRLIYKYRALKNNGNILCRKCRNVLNPPVKRGESRSLNVRQKISLTKRLRGQSVGNKNPNWNPTLTNEERILRKNRHMHNSQHKKWRNSVKERDDYMCQISNTKGDVVSHHLYNFADFPERRYDINNGITISTYLHKLFHGIYGNKNNTKEQFLQFQSTILNGYC